VYSQLYVWFFYVCLLLILKLFQNTGGFIMSATNSCNFVGRLGKAPVVRTAGSAKPIDIANFRIAVNDYIGGKEVTTWVNVVCFNGLANSVQRNADKGTLVTVEGRLQERQWKDKTGLTRYTTEVIANGIQVLTGRKAKEEAQPQQAVQPQGNNAPVSEPPPYMTEDEFVDF
jgi:single-strand DNA-binding protein